jgi:hypothetical protein
MGIQLVRVRTAYADLSSRSGRRKRAAAELATAVGTLTKLEHRLVATPAPSEATKLGTLLVKLVAQQTALTEEAHQLAVFTPRFSVYMTRLRTVSARFDKTMSAIPKPTRTAVRGTRAEVLAANQNFLVQKMPPQPPRRPRSTHTPAASRRSSKESTG